MVGPIRFDGLASGIDFNSIIQQLLAVQKRPLVDLQSRIKTTTDQKNALLEVNVSLLALKGSIDALSRPSFWSSTKVTSSNDTVLGASGGTVSSLGAFSFIAKKLAQTHQLVSSGFADSTTTPVTTTASTVSIELGGGYLDRKTSTSLLNAQTGFDRGSIKVTDSTGKVGVINLEGAVTTQDILDEINKSTSVSVNAFVAGNRIVVQDKAGGAGSMTIEDSGADTTASTLGIAGTSVLVGGNKYVFGTDIHTTGGSTKLSFLNDGMGVRRNSDGASDFTITDTDGVAFGVDVQSGDDTLTKVVSRINTAAGAAGSSLTASLSSGGNSLVLSDAAGVGGVTVALAGGSFAAVDLGLGILSGAAFVQNTAELTTTGVESATGNRLVGNTVIPSLNSTLRYLLNGGQTNLNAADVKGVADGTITITDRQGDVTTLDISKRVATTATVASGAGATALTVASAAGFAVGNRFRIQTSAGVEYRTVTAISGTTLTFDRGLAGSTSVGNGAYALNDSVEDIVRLINDRAPAAGVNVRAQLNQETNGLRIVDLTGATASNLIVAGVPATQLGIAGSVAATFINGTDIDPQYIAEPTLLASLNGGAGVAAGKFRVIDTKGIQFDVDLTQADDTTVFKAIRDINSGATATGSGVVARINDTGDGLVLEDTAPGAGTLQVQELNNGRTARDLNIAGSAPAATPAKVDGSFEFSIAIQANAKLQDVATAINSRSLGVTAAIINDGTPVNPAKLTLTAKRAGEAGRLTVSSAISGLSFSTTSAAQNAVLLYGTNGGPNDPTVITSSQNTISNIVPGLTLQLKGASDTPVTVTVSRDTGAITDQVKRFTDNYNDIIKKIRELTFFNTDSFARGILFTDPAIRRIRRDLSSLVVNPVGEISGGDPNSFPAVGVKVTSDGALTFDSGKFSQALTDNFDKVQGLFTLQRKLKLDTLTKDLNNGRGVTNGQGNDFTVRARNATTKFDVDISGADTLGSLLSKINNAPGNGGVIKAQVSSDGFSVELIDNSVIATRAIDSVVSPTVFVEGDADIDALATGALVGATVTFTSGANTGEVRKVTAFDTATNQITLDSALPFAMSAGDSYKVERELEVVNIGTATAASDLKIAKKLLLGQNTLKSDIINLSQDPGLASRFGERLDFITRRGDGVIIGRTDALDKNVKSFNKSVDRINERLKAAEERLVKQFSRLEISISQSQATLQRLQSSLGSFTTPPARK